MTHLDNSKDTQYHGITKPAFQQDPWDHDYYDFIDIVEKNLKQSGVASDRPATSDVPDDGWYEATDDEVLYRNDDTQGWTPVAYGKDASPTWTSSHTFDAGLTSNGDVLVANGQSVGDVDGDKRLDINSSFTGVADESGTLGFATSSGSYGSRVYARSGESFRIRDATNGNKAVEYTTGNPGTLSLPNAELQAGQNVFVEDGNGFTIGDTSRQEVFGSLKPRLQLHGKSTTESRALISGWSSDPVIDFFASGSSTIGGSSSVNDGDLIGHIETVVDDGNDYDSKAAEIKFEMDGAVAQDDTPGRIKFATTVSGARRPTEALRIDSLQNVEIPNGYAKLSGALELQPTSEPSAPSSGWRLFSDSGDSDKLKAIDSSGNVTTIAS